MSTPVSVEPPPRGHLRTGSEQERDLQAKMQYLIRLQHTANSGIHEAVETDFSGHITVNDGPDGMTRSGRSSSGLLAMTKRPQGNVTTSQWTSSPRVLGGGRSNVSNVLGGATEIDLGVKPDVASASSGKSPYPSGRASFLEGPPLRQNSDVGKGTLVFSGNLLRGSQNYQPGELSGQTPPDRDFYLHQQQQQLHKLQQHLSTHIYSPGAVASMSQPKKPYQQQQQQQQQQQHSFQQQTPSVGLPPQQIYAGYGSVQEQTHEFHYGNPDYGNIDDDDDDSNTPFKGLGGGGGRRRGGGAASAYAACCCERFCCIYRPILQLLSQENLHRSFCYGAIDGLLTGSGIASAFWGLGVLGVRSTWEARLAVVAFSVAACVADALCMAAGHVWTSYIVTSSHARERAQERASLEHNKADSKGKLVDMLLARGMLKIDAMSLADTLEGYPDLFVSALVGDSLLSGTEEIDDDTEDGYRQQPDQHVPVGPLVGNNAPSMGHLGSFGSWKFPSYAHFNSEMQHEPEMGTVTAANRESQKEGLFMLMGFASFAVIPSLIWLVLPLWIDYPLPPTPSSSSSLKSSSLSSSYTAHGAKDDDAASTTQQDAAVLLPSLVIFLLAIIICCLGVWKSRFVDSNWVVFGIETTALLLVCVLTSYGLAALVVYAFGIDAASRSDAGNLLSNDL